jgi:GNAT superfamily N-acetyltransferase
MTDLAVRADAVIRDFYRAFAVSVGGEVVDDDGIVICLGVHPSPIVTNTAWRSDLGRAPDDVLRAIRGAYDAHGFFGSLLTSSRTDADLEAAAEAASWIPVTSLPVMVLPRPEAPSVWPASAGTAARPLDPVVDLDTFRAILADGFFEGDEDGQALVEASFASPASLDGSTTAAFIGTLDGLAASVAGAWLLGADAGIGWVATLPSARRRGLGALVTARAAEWSFEQGAQLAVLQASPSGRPVYEQLGFRPVGLDRLWVSPAT